MKSYQTPANICPHCGYRSDRASGAFDDLPSGPKPGNVSLCLNCGKAAIFTDNLSLRKPTAPEKAELSQDPRILEAQIVRSGVIDQDLRK